MKIIKAGFFSSGTQVAASIHIAPFLAGLGGAANNSRLAHH
jgi:hypothetical protein